MHFLCSPLMCMYPQKHGLKVYLRDPHAFTPMLEDGVNGAPPRSLILGSDLAMNQREIGKFSKKDAKVTQNKFSFFFSPFFSLIL